MNQKKIRIAVLLGDPTGVGPELVAKALAQGPPPADVEYVIIGDKRVFDEACRITGSTPSLPEVAHIDEETVLPAPVTFHNLPGLAPGEYQYGAVDPKAGKTVLDGIMLAVTLAKRGIVDGFVFAPFNKEAMHKAGSRHLSELELFMEEFDVSDIPGEVSLLDDLWLVRVTSHVPLRDVADLITGQRILTTVRLIDRVMKSAGLHNPKIALAGLNPHNGEHGLFGDEELRIIEPAAEACRNEGYNVVGPYPSDTLFLRIEKEALDGIVAMYHDQAQIAMKLMGFDRGVTIHGGLPIPITTAAHGTAFDIAGKNIAAPTAFLRALDVCTRMARTRSTNAKGGED